MHPGPAQIFRGNDFPRGRFDQGGPPEKGVGHFIDHHRLAGHEDQVSAARGVASGAQGDLLQTHGAHARHVVEHGAELLVIRENLGLHGQIGPPGVGDVDAV